MATTITIEDDVLTALLERLLPLLEEIARIPGLDFELEFPTEQVGQAWFQHRWGLPEATADWLVSYEVTPHDAFLGKLPRTSRYYGVEQVWNAIDRAVERVRRAGQVQKTPPAVPPKPKRRFADLPDKPVSAEWYKNHFFLRAKAAEILASSGLSPREIARQVLHKTLRLPGIGETTMYYRIASAVDQDDTAFWEQGGG